MNQSFNAGFNYGNKNTSCKYTNEDILKGYAAALTASISVAYTVRKLTAGITRGATGNRLLLLNAFMCTCAGTSAGFCNTYFMRSTEREKGITVYSDQECTKEIGVSKKSGESAVFQTGVTRCILNTNSNYMPVFLIIGITRFFRKP